MSESEREECPLRELVIRAKLGDRAALEHLLARSIPMVRALLRAYLGGSDDAQDVQQQVLIQVWRSVRGIRDPERYSGWLARLCATRAIDRLRKRNRDSRVASLDAGPVREDPPDPAAEDAFLRLIWGEQVARIEAIVQALPARLREVVALRILDGLEPVDIAARTGKRASSVRALVARGLKRVRRRLEDAR